MSQPVVSDCYEELMVDPSLLQCFAKDKLIPVHGLPYLCALCFHIALESLFTCLASPALWGKAGTDFINNASRRVMSIEITPLAILVTDGIGQGKLGMITTFCRTDQVKVEPSDVLSALVWQDSSKPCVLVVKVFTNSPYFPWGGPLALITWM